MLSITTTTFDLNSPLFIEKYDHDSSDIFEYERRLSKVATLDGKTSFNDTGYTDSDREPVFVIKPATQEEVDLAKYLLQYYSTVRVSMIDGVFLARLNSLTISAQREMAIALYIQEKEVSASV